MDEPRGESETAWLQPHWVGDLTLAVARFGVHLGESMAVVEERATAALARMVTGRGGMGMRA